MVLNAREHLQRFCGVRVSMGQMALVEEGDLHVISQMVLMMVKFDILLSKIFVLLQAIASRLCCQQQQLFLNYKHHNMLLYQSVIHY